MTMWPQFVMIFLSAVGVGAQVQKWANGKQEGAGVIASLVLIAFYQWLLYMGGFYNVFGGYISCKPRLNVVG